MRILISGATGFIGRYLVSVLTRKHQVFALARSRSQYDSCNSVYWIEQDLKMPLDYSRMPGQVDAVIHLAQSKFYREFPTKAEDIFAINIHSTFALLEYARKVGANCFIFASTGGVYGYSYENFAETDPVSPLNFYLSSKYSAELLIANYQQFFRTVVYRFFFVYGPGQKGMLIPSLLDRMQKGETILIEGNPGIRINPIYVADAVRVFEPAFELKYSSLFNVAGDEIVTITDVVSLLEKVVGKQASVEYVDRRVNGDLIGDNRRMKEVLGILPRVSLFEGSHSMIKPEHLSL